MSNENKEHPFAPWRPPFFYNFHGQWIEDCNNQRLLDVRGWGFLTGKGSGALGMDDGEASKIQDEIGRHVTGLMNRSAAPSPEVERLKALLKEAHTQIDDDHGGLPEQSCPTCQLLARIEEAIK